MRLKDYSALCFDMDFTLVNYALDNFIPMAYKALARYLVEIGYSKDILDLSASDVKMMRRGIILDKETHCLIDVSSSGKVLSASLGMKNLTEEQVLNLYPKKKWHHFSSFSKTLEEPFGSPYFTFDSLFGTPAIPLVSKIIDTILLQYPPGEVQDKCIELYQSLMQSFNFNYNPEQFRKNRGYFFPKMKKDVSKFICKASPEWIEKLREFKESGQKIILVTASHIDFAELLMAHAYGENWKHLFDVVSCRARKPGYFTCSRAERPCYRWDEKLSKVVEEPVISEIEAGVVHIEGEWSLMDEFVRRNDLECKIVYIGDSFRSDLVPTKQNTTWDAITVVLEGKKEEVDKKDGPENPYLRDADVQTSNKKQKLENCVEFSKMFGTKSNPSYLHDKLIEYSDLVISDVEVFSKMGLNDVLVRDGNKFYDFNPFPCQ